MYWVFVVLFFVYWGIFRNLVVHFWQRRLIDTVYQYCSQFLVYYGTSEDIKNAYKVIPSFNEVMLKFWVWPLEKFENEEIRSMKVALRKANSPRLKVVK